MDDPLAVLRSSNTIPREIEMALRERLGIGAGAFPVPPSANAIPDYKTCSNTPNVGIFDLGSKNDLINSNSIDTASLIIS